ncbi:hypothetical protein BHE74_00039308, partial [Ensete ventricosum]
AREEKRGGSSNELEEQRRREDCVEEMDPFALRGQLLHRACLHQQVLHHLPQMDQKEEARKILGESSTTDEDLHATSGGILDRTLEAEDRKHGDILRLHRVSISIVFLNINIVNLSWLHSKFCSNAGDYFSTASFETTSIYWMHEVWPRSCPEVSTI